MFVLIHCDNFRFVQSILFLEFELVNFYGAREELINFGLHEWHLKDLSNGWSFVWVFGQHFREKFL